MTAQPKSHTKIPLNAIYPVFSRYFTMIRPSFHSFQLVDSFFLSSLYVAKSLFLLGQQAGELAVLDHPCRYLRAVFGDVQEYAAIDAVFCLDNDAYPVFYRYDAPRHAVFAGDNEVSAVGIAAHDDIGLLCRAVCLKAAIPSFFAMFPPRP